MKQIKIEGGKVLSGEIKVSGAKNSAVALVPASILCDEVVTIDNIPNISDIDALKEILNHLGAKTEQEDSTLTIDPTVIDNREIPEEISKKLRASYYFMGAILGKYKRCEMYFPGGCSIGARPIDLHLKGFEALGATVTNNDITTTKFKCTGTEIKTLVVAKNRFTRYWTERLLLFENWTI